MFIYTINILKSTVWEYFIYFFLPTNSAWLFYTQQWRFFSLAYDTVTTIQWNRCPYQRERRREETGFEVQPKPGVHKPGTDRVECQTPCQLAYSKHVVKAEITPKILADHVRYFNTGFSISYMTRIPDRILSIADEKARTWPALSMGIYTAHVSDFSLQNTGLLYVHAGRPGPVCYRQLPLSL